MITLRAALARFGRGGNSYSWYRRSAQQSGSVSLGSDRVPARKVGGQWMVDEEDVDAALEHELARRAFIAQVTADYEAQLLQGTDGQQLKTQWGGYRLAGPFHFVWSDMRAALHDSNGSWRCNTCWELAAREHEREECHRCRDWSPCGADCTLSAVKCSRCGTRLEL